MTSPASSSHRRRSAHAHEAVLAAAADICGRCGYGSATIETIAAQAGVGKQTIYRWWPNKAALFIEVYGRLVPSGLVAEDTGSLTGDFEKLLRRLSSLYSETPAGSILSGLVAEAQANGELLGQLRDAYVAPRRSIVRQILQRAANRGEIPPSEHADFVGDLFSAAVWFQLLLGRRSMDAAFRQQLADALFVVASGGRRADPVADNKART
jgi:AcrR family transcriptional regulator